MRIIILYILSWTQLMFHSGYNLHKTSNGGKSGSIVGALKLMTAENQIELRRSVEKV